MNNIAFMKVFQCLRDGFKKLFRLRLLQPMLWLGEKIVVERVGSSILLDQKDLNGAFYGVYESRDDWVVEFG